MFLLAVRKPVSLDLAETFVKTIESNWDRVDKNMEGKMKKLSGVFILMGIVVLIMGTTDSLSQSQKKKASSANYLQAWFDEIDADGDGKISRDEHMKHAAQRAETRFTHMDTNKDGVISKDEFKKWKTKKRKKGRGKRKAKDQPQ